MINLRFELQNPWSKDRFKNLGCIYGRITKNKAWELEHTFYDGMLIDMDFKITRRCDHAGLSLVFGLFGYAIHFSIHDTRHWNYEENRWYIYDDKGQH